MTEDNCMKKLLDISVLIKEFESGKLDGENDAPNKRYCRSASVSSW